MFVLQEDDIDGEHIVAFAEEDDPGKCLPPLFFSEYWKPSTKSDLLRYLAHHFN